MEPETKTQKRTIPAGQPDAVDALIEEIKARVFDGRGFVTEKAHRVMLILADFGITVGTIARNAPEFHSGDVVAHPHEIRIYSGNRSVKGRNGWTWYIYDYVAIPAEAFDYAAAAVEKLKKEWAVV